jgi:molybdenum cofactor cytidylyltransferase
VTGRPLPIGTLVLAAGSSSRMGTPKQLARIDGRSLLRGAAEAALSLGAGPVVVVLGAFAEEVEPELDGLPVHVTYNPGWEEGMAASLRVGVAALEERGHRGAVLVTLVDQPRVDGAALQRIVDAFRLGGVDAVAAGYDGIMGAPALFAPSWLPRLSALHGERGALSVLRHDPAAVRVVELPEAADDVDTPADLQRVVERKSRKTI